jgi:hypothetical protein
MVNKRQQLNLRYGKESEFKIYCSMETWLLSGITFPIPKIMLSLILLNILVNKKIPWLLKQDFRYFKIEFL